MYQDNKLITLYSQYAQKNNGTYNSDVVFNFNSVLSEDETFVRAYVSVLNAQIPSSFYNINETNCVLTYAYITLAVVSVTLTKGNYNATNLISELSSKLTAAGTPMTITINKLTGNLTFTATSISFVIIQNPLSALLGLFTEIAYETNTYLQSVSGVIAAPYPLNLLGVKQLLIKSSALSITSFDSRTLGLNDALVSVPCNVAPFGLILYESQSDLDKHVIISGSVEAIDIRITDEHNNPINFNNQNWSISICLSVDRQSTFSKAADLVPYIRGIESGSGGPPLADGELQLLES
jgi:hypothetical protein